MNERALLKPIKPFGLQKVYLLRCWAAAFLGMAASDCRIGLASS